MILEWIKPAVSGSDGTSEFAATLRLSSRDATLVEVQVTPPELLSYSAFQLAVLRMIGRVFTRPECEGRTPEQADYHWREFVDYCLDRSARAALPAAN